jgi:hypothetical protein
MVGPQGKIKGSYTAEKMLNFCRRGTLSASQLLLGIDLNLPYLARQVGISNFCLSHVCPSHVAHVACLSPVARVSYVCVMGTACNAPGHQETCLLVAPCCVDSLCMLLSMANAGHPGCISAARKLAASSFYAAMGALHCG